MTGMGLFPCKQWAKPEMHKSFPHTVNWMKSPASRFFSELGISACPLWGYWFGKWVMGARHTLKPDAKLSFAPYLLLSFFCVPVPDPVWAQVFLHSAWSLLPYFPSLSHLLQRKVGVPEFPLQLLSKALRPFPTDKEDSGVGREDKFEGFLNTMFLISAW